MHYNFILSGAAGRNDITKTAEMGSQGLLRLGQKRANDSLIDHTSVTRRKLETDSKTSVPNGSNLSAFSPWGFGSDLVSGGSSFLTLPRHSKSGRFAEMEARVTNGVSETKRLFDTLSSKPMPSSAYNAYTGENGFLETECNRHQMFSVYARGSESMRRAVQDKNCQNGVRKFTMNGEQVDKMSDIVSSEGFQEMAPPGPLSSYSSLSRGFYGSSFTDLCGNNSFLFGQNILNDPLSANAHISVGFKMGRHLNGSSTFFSLESTNAAMQEAMRNNGKSPEASKSVLKAVSLRKKDRENSNIFPANVKSLLSTGIFDGVAVKYVSWDRTKNVRGTIRGTGYLCWCKNCKKSKMVNAYQLEQHAGSKSKHPNDHIYFSNGKSIYGVVQELKNTSSDKLLEVIPSVTGSGINDENFSKWKESFQAAGRELQRIFGSDSEQGETSSSRNAVVHV